MATKSSSITFSAADMPPLPEYSLTERPRLISGVPDFVVQMTLPVIAYWVVSLIFHIFDEYDLFPQYRLHTPAEISKRNKVTRYEVLRDVVVQQIIQTLFGIFLAYFDPIEMIGREEYDIAVWAQRLRIAQSYIPVTLRALGVDSSRLALNLLKTQPSLSGAIAGGVYTAPGFAAWELQAATIIYWIGVPFAQFVVAVLMVDTWQYFFHRAMHMNKFLYTTLHARHHRLYVPYAYGALYNHPVEGFILDTLGTGLAYLATGMTVRQGMWFFTLSTIKTVDDHCGYAFPWDPVQHLTSNNAAYHDIHHQSWGIKTNFSQPFFTFWDRFLNTRWAGGDLSARYERDRIAAQKKVDADASAAATITNSPATDVQKALEQANSSQQQVFEDPKVDGNIVLEEELREEREAKQQPVRRNTRRKTSGFDPKSISDRVSSSLHGRSATILHADGMR
jgi:sphinganine C4-monooxygenase